VAYVDVFHVDAIRRGIGVGIVYVEVMSLPLLTAAAIVLEMTSSETAQWFGISFVMHLVYGLILGVVVSYGLRAATKGQSRENTSRKPHARRAN
jgi:NhaP-type Na+/H+ or K+/H+ antiporter